MNTNGTNNYDNDNVSIREVEEDRSLILHFCVIKWCIHYYGTITKSAVATGADLVGYSGFSNTNYLEQPYNSDLDYGTGSYIMLCGYMQILPINEW